MVPLIFTILPPTLGLFYFLFRGSMHSGKEEEFLDIFMRSLARYCYAFNGPSMTLLGRRRREQSFFGPYVVVVVVVAAAAAAVIAAAFSSPATCLLILLLLLLLLFEMEEQGPPQKYFLNLFQWISFFIWAECVISIEFLFLLLLLEFFQHVRYPLHLPLQLLLPLGLNRKDLDGLAERGGVLFEDILIQVKFPHHHLEKKFGITTTCCNVSDRVAKGKFDKIVAWTHGMFTWNTAIVPLKNIKSCIEFRFTLAWYGCILFSLSALCASTTDADCCSNRSCPRHLERPGSMESATSRRDLPGITKIHIIQFLLAIRFFSLLLHFILVFLKFSFFLLQNLCFSWKSCQFGVIITFGLVFLGNDSAYIFFSSNSHRNDFLSSCAFSIMSASAALYMFTMACWTSRERLCSSGRTLACSWK